MSNIKSRVDDMGSDKYSRLTINEYTIITAKKEKKNLT